ncbi:ubiquitin carboxyl-terminal hydrolase 2 isoform X2 [Nilaparvata lugens]|uniref:ubiquitin carboxyl-terminal hydrolase 2 isoform X2 n=1 Tax=Nilaparvata lugens TaxID=108931 RepID=UPI00193D73FB|nr:ubiquitin carboxyl-terminal hydrolase 2 isoform X2 [Nilaparvata lugens]XP_039298554.1 ubiquitin carboxyl-terminal hydrolase 2 isoform X2 [Nilaparvata lugens]XP_039298555.1 ubiquitin carboxyl-terminal hydrolase 2 isoform X2 [Nilaparvata lugens]
MYNEPIHFREGSRPCPGLTGLRNIGNTCFLNSIVQCLSNTDLLREFVVSGEYLNHIRSESRGDVIRAFSDLLSDIWIGEKACADPTNFKLQIQRFAPRFTGYSQQDAQEFLRYLLEGLHQDVNKVTVKHRRILPELSDELPDGQKALESWRQYLTLENSHVVELFVGQLKSTLTFTNCGHRSTTFEPFWDLSLPLVQTTTHELKLSDCFDQFMQDEILDGDNMAKCTRCNAQRRCTKRYSIHKYPRVLVVHLKRFSPNNKFHKLMTSVNFPIEGLDLSPYSDNTHGDQVMEYDLYAVSNHSGTTLSGHYTANCRHPITQEWHCFNDSNVTSIQANRVVTSMAYVLFYEQRSTRCQTNRDCYLPTEDKS